MTVETADQHITIVSLCEVIGGETWWEWNGHRFVSEEAALTAARLVPDQEEMDKQEAASIRYACGLRLALLSSGNWAIWYEGRDGQMLDTAPVLDEGWLRSVGENERAARLGFWDRYVENRRRLLAEEAENSSHKGSLVAQKNPEDLGL